MSIASNLDNWEQHNSRVVHIDYEPPSIVKEVQDGWQLRASNGAVLSGLLAGAASQFLAFFKGNEGLSNREPRYQNLVMVLCYTALFLNINATIGSLVLLDTLGKEKEEEYFSSSDPKQVLERCGITPLWNRLRYLWLVTFYFGIVSLTMSVLAFTWLEEARAISITLSVIVGLTIIPVTYFVLYRPVMEALGRSF
ncbi:hypothetical protein BJ912DRAFT_981651 [Pholiota molesta]|nr:hypothetical protein BJ912DRAFT_981651 [Pholiota molesta]